METRIKLFIFMLLVLDEKLSKNTLPDKGLKKKTSMKLQKPVTSNSNAMNYLKD